MKTLHVIVGPTAVGKTAYAIRLARELGCEILSCDSRQFYRELDIGVARPSPEELSAVPHHFIACRSVEQPYNVFDYEQDALALLDHLFKSCNHAVAVGGSGLYVDALCKGINVMPDPTPELRASLTRRIAEGGLAGMLEELKRLDPECYNVIDRNNPIRVQRALEVIHTSGEKYSEIVSKPLPQRPFRVIKTGLYTDRDTLRQRIYSRVDAMMEQGLLSEAKSLLPFRHLNTLNTVGYKELFDFFDGKISMDEAVTRIKNNTWHYAKKQITWLKRYDDIAWLAVNG